MIVQADILKWAERYDERLHAFNALYFSIGATVARLAESNKVCQVVCLFVAFHAEQTERLDVMNTLTSGTAFLACAIISLQRFTALRGPVRPAIIVPSVDVLRMVQAMAVFIAARARAVFTTTLSAFKPGLTSFKGFPAIKAGELHDHAPRWTRLHRSVLAFRRTVFTTAVFQSAGGLIEHLATMPTYQLNSHRAKQTAALLRAALYVDMGRLNLKGQAAVFAD